MTWCWLKALWQTRLPVNEPMLAALIDEMPADVAGRVRADWRRLARLARREALWGLASLGGQGLLWGAIVLLPALPWGWRLGMACLGTLAVVVLGLSQVRSWRLYAVATRLGTALMDEGCA
jgi:hypothetical protein